MSLIDLSQRIGINPKRVASTNGGEYHSPCPKCGGKDRFIIWDKRGRYLCRQCSSKGDAIQFCRDFLGMDFKTACSTVGESTKFEYAYYPSVFESAQTPPILWQERAEIFTIQSAQTLKQSTYAISLLQERGFEPKTIDKFSLGWNPKNQFLPFAEWSLTSDERKLWLPKGLVIPTFSDGKVVKLKIRRTEWHEGDKHPKYVEASGSMKVPSIYGDTNLKTCILVEAEFDAMLIQQYAADLCCSIALGGSSKKPDAFTDRLLRKADIVLYALDFDEAGKKAFGYWKAHYLNLKAWPAPIGKSPETSLQAGCNLREWVLNAINQKELKVCKLIT